jgi:hypothetical protein
LQKFGETALNFGAAPRMAAALLVYRELAHAAVMALIDNN